MYTFVVECCLATKSLNLDNRKWSGCGSGLLGATSNKQFTVLRQNGMSLVQPRTQAGKEPWYEVQFLIQSKPITGRAKSDDMHGHVSANSLNYCQFKFSAKHSDQGMYTVHVIGLVEQQYKIECMSKAFYNYCIFKEEKLHSFPSVNTFT